MCQTHDKLQANKGGYEKVFYRINKRTHPKD